jgi:hypothetical protein
MFRKIRDQVDAASAALGIGDEKIRSLTQMGFDRERARHALDATDGNVDRAADLLLASGGLRPHQQRGGRLQRQAASASGTAADPIDVDGDDGDQMRRAMEESLWIEEERRVRAATEASAAEAPVRGAAASNAGRAALARFEGQQRSSRGGRGRAALARKAGAAAPGRSVRDLRRPSSGGVRTSSGGLMSHHPDVRLPAKLGDKSKEEQLLRCADRLAPHPPAVDTLLVALRAIRNDPANDRYRKVDKTTAGYVRTLEGKPGAEDMLRAMNFRARGSGELVLDRPMVDDALLYLGISALEKARETDQYKEAKQRVRFVKELNEIRMGGNDCEAEALRRAEFIAKCPSEPGAGAGALIQLTLGDDVVRRRFDADDVLGDVTNWIGGHGSAIPDQLVARKYVLMDINRYPATPIDTVKNAGKTLQFIGCFPSGRLEIRSSPDDWKKDASGQIEPAAMGSSRGLGSAPTSELH